MLVYEKTSVYLAIELSLREISYVLHVRALMTQKSCAVGMRNAKLGNHLNYTRIYTVTSGLGSVHITPEKFENGACFHSENASNVSRPHYAGEI